MCLLEFVVHWNLKPKASTEQTVDLPQVAICPGPVSEPGGLISCGYFPGRLVGPVRAVAQAFTLPTISVPHLARSGAISKVISARSTPRTCRPSLNSAATRAGNPPAWPPKMRGSTSAWRSPDPDCGRQAPARGGVAPTRRCGRRSASSRVRQRPGGGFGLRQRPSPRRFVPDWRAPSLAQGQETSRRRNLPPIRGYRPLSARNRALPSVPYAPPLSQVRGSGAAHSSQNFALALFSCWHCWHFIEKVPRARCTVTVASRMIADKAHVPDECPTD